MKILFLIIMFTLSLVARENPFKPTQTFLELKNKDQNKSISVSSSELNTTVSMDLNKSNKKLYQYTPLKGVSLSQDDTIIKLQVDRKYPLIQQIISDDNTKFVFDFKGRYTFYTIRKKLKSDYFISYALGTHLEDNFFRVVIKVKNNIDDYKTIQENNNTIVIQYNLQKSN